MFVKFSVNIVISTVINFMGFQAKLKYYTNSDAFSDGCSSTSVESTKVSFNVVERSSWAPDSFTVTHVWWVMLGLKFFKSTVYLKDKHNK